MKTQPSSSKVLFRIFTLSLLLILPILLNAKEVVKLRFEADDLKVSTPTIKLEKDTDVTVKVSGISDFDYQKLDISCKDFCIANKNSDGNVIFKLNPKYFNTKEETKDILIEATKGDSKFKIIISAKIPARINVIDKNEAKITIVEGEEIKTPEGYKYSVDGGDEINQVTFKNDKLIEKKEDKFSAKTPGLGKFEVFSTTDKPAKLAEIPVQILAAIKNIESVVTTAILLTELVSTPFKIAVKGNDGKLINYYSRIECKPLSSTYLSINKTSQGFYFAPKSVNGKEEQPVEIKCNIIADEKKTLDTAEPLTLAVKVIPKKGVIKIEEVVGTTLLPNGSLPFNIRLYTTNNMPSNGVIVYELENENDKQWVSLTDLGEKLIVRWVDLPNKDEKDKPIEKRPHSVNIKVKATLTDGSSIIASNITIHMASIARFESLKVKLNIMDERTVSDLYGRVTSDEYYVLMVRLFNDLKESETNKSQGESILAYSSSIEIAVALEKQYDKDSKTGNLGVITKEQMKGLQKERSIKLFGDYKSNLAELDEIYNDLLEKFNIQMKEAFEKDRIAQELEIDATSDKDKSEAAKKAKNEAMKAFQLAANFADKLNNLYQMNTLSTPKTPTPDAPIDDGKWYPANRNDLFQAKMEESDFLAFDKNDEFNSTKSHGDGEPTCVDTITYRPFTFEMMVNTVDRRQERSPKSWGFKILNFIGLATSTITAIAVPGKGSDLPVGLDKFSNFFIPGLEKLIPNYKEQYRQNIVSQAMKPIEEIPFGSDITRVIFIPKKSIKGLIVGHNARISQICPYYFKIKVAVVSKGGEVTLGSQQNK